MVDSDFEPAPSPSLHDPADVAAGRALPNLHLGHPTDDEKRWVWTLTSASWRGPLSVDQYLGESAYLAASDAPLARDGGITYWILVDKDLPPSRRQVLASCETLRKKALLAGDSAEGGVKDVIVYGVRAVYCDPRFRRRGYATRMLRELNKILPTWQVEERGDGRPVAASILYSGIGKKFYANVGWQPFPSYHLEFSPAAKGQKEEGENKGEGEDVSAEPLYAHQLAELCEEDEALCRRAMARPYPEGHQKKNRIMILPNHDHMYWHHRHEEFVSARLYGTQPQVKGAIAGEKKDGNRVWAVWTHRFYGRPDDEKSGNTLYILRLVVENQDLGETDLPVKELKAVIQAAQNEAAVWNFQHVMLWGPSPEIEDLVRRTGVQYRKGQRDEDGVCSLQWFMDGSDEDSVEWVGNEKYAWC